MAFDIFLNSSLIILAVGLVLKCIHWFSCKIGIRADGKDAVARAASALSGIRKTILSPGILSLFRVFFLDILLQYKILKQDLLRWIMHMLIFWGFMLLLFMHALEDFVSESIFAEYYSTLNPFMFLRDFFGAMVVAGLCIAVFRRVFMKIPRLTTNRCDIYAIVIVALIIFSGFFLEAGKIISYSEFCDMEDYYSGLDSKQEIFALECYWVKNYGLVSPNDTSNVSQKILDSGEEIHGQSCMECHTKPQSAFGGFVLSRVLAPAGGILEKIGSVNIFYYIHIIACFAGLALLPFSKMLHIVTTPLALFSSAVMKRDKADPANIATRQMIELDACVHCNTCSKHCSVAPAFDIIGNENILPSERMMALRKYKKGRNFNRNDFSAIQQGITLCSSCERCTVVCPAGINLKELWYDVREEFIRNESIFTPLVLTPYSYNRSYAGEAFQTLQNDPPASDTKAAVSAVYRVEESEDHVLTLNGSPEKKSTGDKDGKINDTTFSYCFSCENCTNVCPVVMNYENPEKALGLLPHQIMRSLGLGLKDLALGAGMLWDCLTCYQCQEHCPQNVKVTDIFYELKNQISKDYLNNNDKES